MAARKVFFIANRGTLLIVQNRLGRHKGRDENREAERGETSNNEHRTPNVEGIPES
jgi:hypothetical protein